MSLKTYVTFIKEIEKGDSLGYGRTYIADEKRTIATIPAGYADVVVCEAFVGNVILKLYEGVGAALVLKIKEGMMTSLRSKIGALLVKPALKSTLKSFAASEYGGAPLLGLKGLVVKTHGSAKAIEIKHGIFQCVQFKQQKINEKIAERILEDQE